MPLPRLDSTVISPSRTPRRSPWDTSATVSGSAPGLRPRPRCRPRTEPHRKTRDSGSGRFSDSRQPGARYGHRLRSRSRTKKSLGTVIPSGSGSGSGSGRILRSKQPTPFRGGDVSTRKLARHDMGGVATGSRVSGAFPNPSPLPLPFPMYWAGDRGHRSRRPDTVAGHGVGHGRGRCSATAIQRQRTAVLVTPDRHPPWWCRSDRRRSSPGRAGR